MLIPFSKAALMISYREFRSDQCHDQADFHQNCEEAGYLDGIALDGTTKREP
jgi:hypothetical protein